ncbi:conserved hypothetical protein [Vibrio crassostreae]|nr:conserved hypothetical protein [Vibrio chagasii]CAK2854643.1 conserved hypothetical protein [Vibrio crassostreae]
MKNLLKSLLNFTKRLYTNIALTVCFFAKTRDFNLSRELANIHNLVVGLTPAQINRRCVVTSVFDKYIQHGSERDERLKRRYLVSILPSDKEIYDDVKLNKDYGERSEYRQRLTVAIPSGVKRFVRDLPALPFYLAVIVLWIPVSYLVRIKRSISRDQTNELMLTWWELLNGFLSEGHGYTHHWPFEIGEDFDTRYWMKQLRYSMPLVPYSCREKLVQDFKNQRKVYRNLNADYKRRKQSRL